MTICVVNEWLIRPPLLLGPSLRRRPLCPSSCRWFSWLSAWILLPRAEMILAFLIVNNFGKARMLKFYRETVRVPSWIRSQLCESNRC